LRYVYYRPIAIRANLEVEWPKFGGPVGEKICEDLVKEILVTILKVGRFAESCKNDVESSEATIDIIIPEGLASRAHESLSLRTKPIQFEAAILTEGVATLYAVL